MKIVGISGKMGAGKDTLANWVSERLKEEGELEPVVLSFASPLKKACCAFFSWDEIVFNDRTLKEKTDPFWGISPRQAAQLLGTEGFRHLFGDDIHIRAMEKTIDSLPNLDRKLILIPDIRFDNEADFVRSKKGVIIHLKSSDQHNLNDATKAHASESGIREENGDVYLYNDKLKGLGYFYSQIDRLLDDDFFKTTLRFRPGLTPTTEKKEEEIKRIWKRVLR